MTNYIIGRILATLPVLLIVALVVFMLLRLAPGDPAAILVGADGTLEEMREIRKDLGLDRPIPVQLGLWFGQILRGDLGDSLLSGHSVASLIKERIVATLSLTILTEIITVGVGVPLGVLAAWKANTWIDRTVMVAASIGFAMPVFWLAFLLIRFFAVDFNLFPAAGYTHPSEGFGSFLHHLILPAISTGAIVMALVTRMTRATVLEVLNEDYVRTARAKGLRETVVLTRHALRNAAIPVITVIGLGLASLLGGLVVTESVFGIPGMGRLLLNAIFSRDYPIIQGTILIISGIYVGVNLLIDISYVFFDPRIRY